MPNPSPKIAQLRLEPNTLHPTVWLVAHLDVEAAAVSFAIEMYPPTNDSDSEPVAKRVNISESAAQIITAMVRANRR